MINKSLIYIPLGIIIGIMFILLLIKDCKNRKLKGDVTLLKELGDTLSKKRNKDNTETSKISLLESTNTKLILQLQTKDETIKSLQQAIRQNANFIKNGGSVTVFTNTTTYSNTANTNFIIIDSNSVYEASNTDTTWVKWRTKASKDSTHLDLEIKNAYTVVIGSERIGLFKRKSIVEVTNKNPYTSTQALRAFQVKEDKVRRFGIGLQAGYGVTLKGLSPYLGVGINFKIL